MIFHRIAPPARVQVRGGALLDHVARRNDRVVAKFDVGVQARTVEEMAALQQEFVQTQMKAAAEQGQQLGQLMGKAATSATKQNGQPGRKPT